MITKTLNHFQQESAKKNLLEFTVVSMIFLIVGVLSSAFSLLIGDQTYPPHIMLLGSAASYFFLAICLRVPVEIIVSIANGVIWNTRFFLTVGRIGLFFVFLFALNIVLELGRIGLRHFYIIGGY